MHFCVTTQFKIFFFGRDRHYGSFDFIGFEFTSRPCHSYTTALLRTVRCLLGPLFSFAVKLVLENVKVL